MYLWVVLTTFLAMIAAYYLPIRGDTADKVDTGVARGQLVQMVAKQKAAMQYMIEHSYPFYCDGTDCAAGNCSACDTDYNRRRRVSYLQNNEIPFGTLATYLPRGFINNGTYRTVIHCVTESGDEDNLVYAQKNDCHRDNDSATYNSRTRTAVITSGPIPERWRTYTPEDGTTKPSPDLMAAMREQLSNGETAGYAYMSGDNLVISTYDHIDYIVPPAIRDRNISGTLKSCVDDNGICLVYFSWR